MAYSFTGVETAISLLVLLIAVPTSAAVFAYVFLFKTMAHMQSRLGPMEAGPHGSFQLIAEALKWIGKEDLFPRKADRLLFGIAPVVALLTAFLLFAVIPVSNGAAVANVDLGVLFVLAVAGLSTIAVLMAGWGSASKYSVIGGLRAAAQLLAYEIPLVLATIGVVIQAGSMNLQDIVNSQTALWFVVPQVLGFLVFFIAAQAELAQAPFDMPLAESELVTGYLTEYSGFRFLLFFISELATAAALSALAVTLFLGGWNLPFLDLSGTAAAVFHPIIFLAKTMLVAFLIFWIRFSLPRFREDQLQSLAWKILIPVTLVNLLATAVLKVAL